MEEENVLPNLPFANPNDEIDLLSSLRKTSGLTSFSTTKKKDSTSYDFSPIMSSDFGIPSKSFSDLVQILVKILL